MKRKIITDLIGDGMVALIITEGILIVFSYLSNKMPPQSPIHLFMKTWGVLIGIAIALLVLLYYSFCGMMCFKKCNRVIAESGFDNDTLYKMYKDANKCCQYRVNKPVVFVNTAHGIVMMLLSDVYERKTKTVHHTRSRRTTVHGNTRRVDHLNDYYTYHFIMKTKYGTFKSNVGNRAVLDELRSLW